MDAELHPPITQDIEINRSLCLDLMQRLAEALRLAYQECGEQAEAEHVLPLWVPLLFGTKEGLLASYIKLSQQHLKIIASQIEVIQHVQSHASQQEKDALREDALTPEDVMMIRGLLAQLGGAES